jgi:hypothetical protein
MPSESVRRRCSRPSDPDKPLEIKKLPPVEPLEIEPIVKVAALQAEGERP